VGWLARWLDSLPRILHDCPTSNADMTSPTALAGEAALCHEDQISTAAAPGPLCFGSRLGPSHDAPCPDVLMVTAEAHRPSAWADGPPKLSVKTHPAPAQEAARLVCVTCVP
jgi:hypothetical protein